ncbi:MAG: alpha-L-rhamnosidase N-terminal domain-containing protein, partial [Alistipes sp.]
MKRAFILGLTLLLALDLSAANPIRIEHLTCEGLVNPLAIDSTIPHFGWQLRGTKRDISQRAYRIRVASDSLQLLAGRADLWDSGDVVSDASVGVPYIGAGLKAQQRCWWQVTVTAKGSNKPIDSSIASFGIGLIDPAVITGEFIGHTASGATAVLLRQKFHVRSLADQALMHVNSLGYHEVWINGDRVGDACLAPAVSQLDKRSLWVSYDVGSYLHEGNNEVVIWLGQGWYKPNTFGRWQPDESYAE